MVKESTVLFDHMRISLKSFRVIITTDLGGKYPRKISIVTYLDF